MDEGSSTQISFLSLQNPSFNRSSQFAERGIFPKKYCFVIFFLVLFSDILQKANCWKDNKCYVLALEGGGDKGAYQAGAISGLIANLPTDLTQYDVVTGISVGSINAAAFSIYEPGKEREAADFLLNKWRSLKGKRSIFKNWFFGPLYGLLFKSGLYDSSPLHDFLDNLVDNQQIKRKVVVGATNIVKGTYQTWDETNFIGNLQSYIDAVMASTAVPILFPNYEKDGMIFVDGGVKVSLDIPSGINKCLDMGYPLENIYIDAILCSSTSHLPEIDVKRLKTEIKQSFVIGSIIKTRCLFRHLK